MKLIAADMNVSVCGRSAALVIVELHGPGRLQLAWLHSGTHAAPSLCCLKRCSLPVAASIVPIHMESHHASFSPQF